MLDVILCIFTTDIHWTCSSVTLRVFMVWLRWWSRFNSKMNCQVKCGQSPRRKESMHQNFSQTTPNFWLTQKFAETYDLGSWGNLIPSTGIQLKFSKKEPSVCNSSKFTHYALKKAKPNRETVSQAWLYTSCIGREVVDHMHPQCYNRLRANPSHTLNTCLSAKRTPG